jgi:hypothetical protein
LNLVVFPIAPNAQSAQDLLALTEVFAVFDAHDDSADDLSVPLAFGKVLPANFGPVDLCTMEDFESVGIIDFDSLGDIGAFNDGSIVLESALDEVGSLIEVVILVHPHYNIYLTLTTSQINLSLDSS